MNKCGILSSLWYLHNILVLQKFSLLIKLLMLDSTLVFLDEKSNENVRENLQGFYR